MQTHKTIKVKTGCVRLHVRGGNGGPFEMEGERVLTNNVTFPHEFNPHHVRLWVIGNEYGALGAVWADCEQDAFDELVDAGLGAGLAIDESDADEETARLGNAGEPHDLTNAWIKPIELRAERDLELMLALAEARGAGQSTLTK